MFKHLDYCTHVQFPEDKEFLTNCLFDVNMRLFKSSHGYRNVVLRACDYMSWWCVTEKEGYTRPRGVSGANVGIPWNIIAFEDKPDDVVVMINPKILKRYGVVQRVMSNCGSLTLPESIPVLRDEIIDVEFFDRKGVRHVWKGVDRSAQGFTIQHEVDHNLGILITDRNDNR